MKTERSTMTAERPLAVEIGKRLRWAREMAGLRQNQVSSYLPGIGNIRLSNYENGIRVPGIELAKQLGRLYGVSAAYLLTIEDTPGSAIFWKLP